MEEVCKFLICLYIVIPVWKTEMQASQPNWKVKVTVLRQQLRLLSIRGQRNLQHAQRSVAFSLAIWDADNHDRTQASYICHGRPDTLKDKRVKIIGRIRATYLMRTTRLFCNRYEKNSHSCPHLRRELHDASTRLLCCIKTMLRNLPTAHGSQNPTVSVFNRLER